MSKTILITGGSRGIGRACAIAAAERGWSVGANYVSNVAEAERLVAELKQRGASAAAMPGDVSNAGDVTRMFDDCEQALGPLDGVVINAGIVAPALPLAEMPEDRLRRMFEVNVLGAYLVARESSRRLARRYGGRGGSIVLVSSIASRLGSPNEFVDYAGSKGAIDSLTIGLAKEIGGHGVRVNAVRPGLIDTDIHASGGQPDRVARLGPLAPLGRAGTPEEVAEAVVWLLSDQSSYVSGALLDVSGGR